MAGSARVFFLGNLAKEWMSGWQRCETLRGLNCQVIPFCQSTFLQRAEPSRWKRLTGRSRFDAEAVGAFNRAWLSAVCESGADLAWLEWPKLLQRETLTAARARLPRCRFVAFYDDNPFGDRTDELWQWQVFFNAIPEFDLHLVKRPSDLAELERRGARRAELFMHGYFAPLFEPSRGGAHFDQDVSFVGTALDHRVAFIRRLIAHEKIPLRVFGNRWDRTLIYHLRRDHFRPAVLGKAYADVLRRSRVSLGFVSSSNHDEYTMRTFEIPACQGFLLAERTTTHQELFIEGKEAEFFSSVEECADKIRFYLKEEALRRRIAAQGYLRCLDSDYSLRRRLRDALQQIEKLEP